MANFVGSVHKLGRQLQYLAGYFDFSADDGVARVTNFATCERPVLLLYGFFATRQTPTTGATLPVDGGLPDATPR